LSVVALHLSKCSCKLRNLRWNKLQDVLPPEIGELKKLTHL